MKPEAAPSASSKKHKEKKRKRVKDEDTPVGGSELPGHKEGRAGKKAKRRQGEASQAAEGAPAAPQQQQPQQQRPLKTLSIAVCASVLGTAQTGEQAAAAAGAVARAAAVFCADEVVVVADPPPPAPQARDGQPGRQEDGRAADAATAQAERLARILQYMETPQYLRKALIPMHADLRLAGRLPPLDAPHHRRAGEWCAFREGAVAASAPGAGSLLDVGLARSAHVEAVIPPGTRATVELGPAENVARLPPGAPLGDAGREVLRGRAVSPLAPRRALGLYWGFSVRLAARLTDALRGCPFNGGGAYDAVIGTSERGTVGPVQGLALPEGAKHLLVLFGGPAGLEACYRAEQGEGADAGSLCDHWVNVCPGQGSRTIRTEEAILVALQFLRPLWYP